MTPSPRTSKPTRAAEPDAGLDSGLFASTLSGTDMDDDPPLRTDWDSRAAAIGAQTVDAAEGARLLTALWQADRHVLALSPDELQHLCAQLRYASVARGREVIGQNELGDFMLVVLQGTLTVDRLRADGGRTRLAEAHAGDMVGEMALLDAGARFCACVTLTPAVVGVLDARQLDALFNDHPRIGLALVATLSRRLSLRLRQVSARLSALL